LRAIVLIGTVAGLVLIQVSCSKEPTPPKPAVADTGRPETRSIEAADAMGYNGKEIRHKLDRALDANDATTKQMDQAANQ
jgi:hypothetical protein